jgi:hypothetical protein
MNILLLASAITLPLASALTPAGRWGHQAVYVPSEAAMYVIGGQVDTNSQITNDVLVMPVSDLLPVLSPRPTLLEEVARIFDSPKST